MNCTYLHNNHINYTGEQAYKTATYINPLGSTLDLEPGDSTSCLTNVTPGGSKVAAVKNPLLRAPTK